MDVKFLAGNSKLRNDDSGFQGSVDRSRQDGGRKDDKADASHKHSPGHHDSGKGAGKEGPGKEGPQGRQDSGGPPPGAKQQPGNSGWGRGDGKQPPAPRQNKMAVLPPAADGPDPRREASDDALGDALDKPDAGRLPPPKLSGNGSKQEGVGGEARLNQLDSLDLNQSKLLGDANSKVGVIGPIISRPPPPGAGPQLTPGTVAYNDFVKAHPGADSLSKELVLQGTSLIDLSLILGPGGGMQDGKMTWDDFHAAAENFNLSPQLRAAAKLFSNPGMFRLLDTASQDPATAKADGIVSQDDIRAWAANGAPTTEQEFRDVMMGASLGNALDGANIMGLGPDVFANPGNYTGKQKTAVLRKLQETASRIEAGKAEGLWDGGFGDINDDETKVMADLRGRIDQLSQDKDVQGFVATVGDMWLRPMIQGDAGLKAAFDQKKADFLSGKSLNAELTMMGVKAGLAEFVKEGAFLSESGRHVDFPPGYLGKIVQASPRYTQVMAYYETNVVSGKDLQADLDSGMDPTLATQKFAAEMMNFSSVLPSNLLGNTAHVLQGNYSDIMSTYILGKGTQADLNSAIGDASGNLDAAKLNAIMSQALGQDPNLFKDENGKPIPQDKIAGAVKQVFDMVRAGAKISDALDKVKIPNLGQPGIQNGYGQGMLHAVSAIIAGGILAAKTTQGVGDGKTQASAVASGANMMGLMMEAGAKYASKNPGANMLGLAGNSLKQIENSGKMLGALGSAVGGALGIYSGVQSLAQGDKVGAGVNLSSGIAGLLAAGTSFVDGAVGFAGTLGLEVAAGLSAGIAGIAGAFSIGAGVIGVIGLFVMAIKEQEKADKREGDFKNKVLAVLHQFGINGGGPAPDPGDPGHRDPEPNDPTGRGRGGGSPW